MPQNLLTATSNLPQVLVNKFVESGLTNQYQGPSGSVAASVKIATATLCNTSAAAVLVTVAVLKAGTAVGNEASGTILSGYSLAAGDSIRLTELIGGMLGPSDSIWAKAPGSGTAVTLVMTGAVSS
jgi:hypothetical protein